MKHSRSEKQPKPQPKWNGAPPKPPKRTARDLLDGGDSSDEVFALVSRASETWFELERLRLGGAAGPRIRESLEAKLDTEIVALGGLVRQAEGVVRERVMDCEVRRGVYRFCGRGWPLSQSTGSICRCAGGGVSHVWIFRLAAGALARSLSRCSRISRPRRTCRTPVTISRRH